jgi:hypothetical protein
MIAVIVTAIIPMASFRAAASLAIGTRAMSSLSFRARARTTSSSFSFRTRAGATSSLLSLRAGAGATSSLLSFRTGARAALSIVVLLWLFLLLFAF